MLAVLKYYITKQPTICKIYTSPLLSSNPGLPSYLRIKMELLKGSMNNHTDFYDEGYISMESPIELSPPESEVPVIDLSEPELLSARQPVVDDIKQACQDYGMFQVENHGISNEVLTNAMTSAIGFFDLPHEELDALSGIVNLRCMLYSSSYAYAIGIEGRRYWRDALQLGLKTTEAWPTQPHTFQGDVWQFASSAKLVEDRLLSFISEGLGLHQNHFESELRSFRYILVNQYPQCAKPTMTCGIPTHCDPSIITISLLGNVPGTQISIDGEWRRVAPSINRLLVTVGHQLEVISNGTFKAPIHREVVNSEIARTTISYFSEPSYTHVMGPAEEITRTNPARYKNYKYNDYLEHYVYDNANTCSILQRYFSC